MTTKTDTITVAGTSYDVTRGDRNGNTILTLDAFPGIEGTVRYDDDTSYANPRTSTDCNLGTMAVAYRGYNLGDENAEMIDFDVECSACEGSGEVAIEGTDVFDQPNVMDCKTCEGTGTVTLDPATYFREQRGARIVIPLFVYDHSGITIRDGSPVICRPLAREDVRSSDRFAGDGHGWDTSFVGFLFDDPAQLVKCGCEGFTDDELIEALQSEIREYASYLEGDVTYYTVEDDETGYYDSCGGFVGGYGEYAIEECFGSMEGAIEARLAEIAERAHWAACDVVTV